MLLYQSTAEREHGRGLRRCTGRLEHFVISSTLSNHPDHDPPSRPDATPVLSHRPPPPTRTHHKPPPRSWSTARAQCQRDTGSATSTTISPHDSESATLDPTLRPPGHDPQTAIHGAATEALDLRVIKQRDSGEGG
ncbi:unnamed protein product [Pleuronectes platessa]|uniref:Uncharacterized protein n=1 Tax=Pleuronectes platessa TaxID=8262 RepID=A0A9N7URA8_PLEPL|nr:unnamed protein product [Pleuronectes platessa]